METPLTNKEWQSLLDNYLVTGRIDGEIYERCDDAERWLINELKKSILRIKNRE